MFNEFYDKKLFGDPANSDKAKILKKEIQELQTQMLRESGFLVGAEDFDLAHKNYEELIKSMAAILEHNFKLVVREKLLPSDIRVFVDSTCDALKKSTMLLLDDYIKNQG